MILPFKKNYFNFKTATAKPGGTEGTAVRSRAAAAAGGGSESHLSYKRACYLLTGTTPIVRVCRCGTKSSKETVIRGRRRWGERCSHIRGEESE